MYASAVVITTYFSVVRCVQSQIYYNIQFVCRFFFARSFVRPFSPTPITLMMSPQWTIASAVNEHEAVRFVVESIFGHDSIKMCILVAKKEADEEEAYRCSKVSNTSIICEKWFERSHQYFAFAYTFNGIKNLSFALLTQTIFFILLWRLFTVHWI